MNTTEPTSDATARRRSRSAATFLALVERDGAHCAYCTIPLAHHLLPGTLVASSDPGVYEITPGLVCGARDHVVPKSRGGSDDLDNQVPVCYPCNSRKGARLLSELPAEWHVGRRA